MNRILRSLAWLSGAALLIALPALLVGEAEDRPAGASTGLQAVSAIDSPSGGIVEDLGLPRGPFDPVLQQPASDILLAPPLNRVVNDPTGEDVGIVQSEVAIAVRGDTIVVGWNDGIGFVGGGTVSGYGYSVDRGETWTDGGEVPNGQGTSVYGDPTVVVTNDGLWLFMSLDLGSPYGLALNRARFSGGTLALNPATKYTDNNAFIDKEFLEHDAATDRIYLTYTIGSGRLSMTSNGGDTWSTPLTIASGSNPNGFYPAPGIDGEVYVSWMDPLAVANARCYVRYSSNGGQSWAGNAVQVVQLGPQSAQPPRCFNRGFNVTFPAMSIDRSDGPHRGRAHFVYHDGGPGNFDVFYTYSDDKGQTWAPAVQLNGNQNETEQFWPQVHVGPHGRITVTWYDRRHSTNNNGLCDLYGVQSVDGGTTWGPNRRISDTSVTWCNVPANIMPNFGDYIELTSDDRSIFAVWSDARLGDPDVLFGRVDDRHLLAVSGEVSGESAPLAGEGTAWFMPNEGEIRISPDPDLAADALLAVPSLALAVFATPAETNGLFQIAGEALSADVTMSAQQGQVTGRFSCVRTGPGTIDLDFEAAASASLEGLALLPNWTIEATLVDGGPGQVNLFGVVTMTRLLGPVSFALGGTIRLEGAPDVVLPGNQKLLVTALRSNDGDLVVRTRTAVEDGVVVQVEPLVLGENPPPLATVRATPNPLGPRTQIAYTLSGPATGAIRLYTADGRLVRTIRSGSFEAGEHRIPFDGRDDSGRRLAAGGYFLRFETDLVQAAAKMFVLH